ncbi:recombination mediator RecR [Entomospira entomophila]|uniref:Recombination protein RecR n=1 Tax=Entomospira entomophila TaxID=2719988 RepID=A0A968G7H7_9SPIO|nr:recombination mediator RecR [Entomospira entomophilus]NIZ40008.1 recombination protein RecR [Entomospira entomophilus]WDI35568.1 recombination mediator RecR [Entomospira entomophilus]
MRSLLDMTLTLSRLPGIGTKSAKRIAYFLLEEPKLAEQLITNIQQVAEDVHTCEICGAYFDSDVCPYCTSTARRESGMLCIVERPMDIFAIEALGIFQGRYHVLGGALSPMTGIGPEQLRIESLKSRITEESVTEIIVATNLNLEGDATAHYLEQILQSLPLKITRLATGLSAGSYLEYADKESLARSFQDRRRL